MRKNQIKTDFILSFFFFSLFLPPLSNSFDGYLYLAFGKKNLFVSLLAFFSIGVSVMI